MKRNKKRNLAITLTALLCIVLFSCARERGRTDINLEMTDEDSVEAIIDQDLLTAGGTIVNLEEPEQTASADTVSEVEEVEMQTPVVVSADQSLKPKEESVSDDQPAIGLIDVEDVEIDSPGKAQEENLSAKRPEEEVLSTEELIAENKALISAAEKTDAVENTEKVADDETVSTGDNTTSTTTTATTVENVDAENNVLPGESATTVVEEVSIEEMAFPDEVKNNVEKIGKTGKPEKPVPMPTAVRPPGGGYYTEYTTMDKTVKTAKPVKTAKTIKTPSYPTHTVKRGDTLWVISRKYGCTISELVTANNISRRSILKIGQVLRIPTDESKKKITNRLFRIPRH